MKLLKYYMSLPAETRATQNIRSERDAKRLAILNYSEKTLIMKYFEGIYT